MKNSQILLYAVWARKSKELRSGVWAVDVMGDEDSRFVVGSIGSGQSRMPGQAVREQSVG